MQQGYAQEVGSSVNQPGLVLPTQSMQSHIHELAKSLPPPRKQNTACDACRARKVKCNRLPGQEKCQHCLSKNYPCTHFVQQATSEKKRNAARKPRNLTSGASRLPFSNASPTSSASPGRHKFTPPLSDSSSQLSPPPNFTAYPQLTVYRPPGPWPTITTQTSTPQLLAYIFAPPENSSESSPAYNGVPSAKLLYAEWGDLACKLEDESFRFEFALDLVEVYFQIVHTRIPLLNPTQFRTRFNLSPLSVPVSSSASIIEKPLHPALVTTVLAWGTKFSEHPLLVADRQRHGGSSFLAKTMVDRARELAEALKVHRVPSADHVVICMLIEILQSQNPDDSQGFHGFWLTSSIRHLFDMQINHKSVMTNIQDPEARGTMIFAWWMTCIADAYHSVYYRRKPLIDDDDYDIDFYTADPVSHESVDLQSIKPSPREHLEFLGYYRASHALARIARHMAQLWRPAFESDGIPHELLASFKQQLSDWRDTYLPQVGVSTNLAAEWDFISAISACASDATYHLMWIILFNAMDDFGIRDVSALSDESRGRVMDLQRKITDEAVHGALRIAGLAGVLASNGYLRLDPAVMHISCIQAGTLLARLGRPEVSNCIAGLEQYSYAYEEARDQVAEMKRAYTAAQTGDFDFNHLAAIAPTVSLDSHDMALDRPGLRDGTGPAQNIF